MMIKTLLFYVGCCFPAVRVVLIPVGVFVIDFLFVLCISIVISVLDFAADFVVVSSCCCVCSLFVVALLLVLYMLLDIHLVCALLV